MYELGDGQKFWRKCTGCDTEIFSEDDAWHGDDGPYCSKSCSGRSKIAAQRRLKQSLLIPAAEIEVLKEGL